MAARSACLTARSRIKALVSCQWGLAHFYIHDGAAADAPAASRVICLHLLAGTMLVGMLSGAILLRTSWFSLVGKVPKAFLCLAAGLTAAQTT